MKKSYFHRLAIGMALFLIFIGPWPLGDTHYRQTLYAQNTLSQISKIKTDSRSGQLFANTAKVDITPAKGVPMGGYSARNPKANIGALAPVFAKAITINNGYQRITILSADILLPLPELIDRILEQTNSLRNDIYFASTHTHSGPGGYDSTFIGQQALGNFSQKQLDLLSQQMSAAVIKSRQNLKKVSLHYQRFNFKDEFRKNYIYNQLTKNHNAHDSIHLLQVKNQNTQTLIGNIISFSAHPTFLGRVNRKISGDYPTLIMQQLEEKTGAITLFMSGAAGGVLPIGLNRKPASEIEVQLPQMQDFSSRFSQQLLQLFDSRVFNLEIKKTAEWSNSEASIQSTIINIDLPYSNYRVAENFRISPLLIDTVFHNRKTFIQQLKIGNLVFLAYPADYSGILAKKLETWASDKNIYPWATSFNGDYIGYAMPGKYKDQKSHIMRSATFFGPWVGDYFYEISQKMLIKASYTN